MENRKSNRPSQSAREETLAGSFNVQVPLSKLSFAHSTRGRGPFSSSCSSRINERRPKSAPRSGPLSGQEEKKEDTMRNGKTRWVISQSGSKISISVGKPFRNSRWRRAKRQGCGRLGKVDEPDFYAVVLLSLRVVAAVHDQERSIDTKDKPRAAVLSTALKTPDHYFSLSLPVAPT